jgi:hypothetical protein
MNFVPLIFFEKKLKKESDLQKGLELEVRLIMGLWLIYEDGLIRSKSFNLMSYCEQMKNHYFAFIFELRNSFKRFFEKLLIWNIWWLPDMPLNHGLSAENKFNFIFKNF